MFIFTGHRLMIDEILNTEYVQNPCNRSGASEWHTCKRTPFQKPLLCNPGRGGLTNVSYFLHIYYAGTRGSVIG
jgi:hypothetical protein